MTIECVGTHARPTTLVIASLGRFHRYHRSQKMVCAHLQLLPLTPPNGYPQCNVLARADLAPSTHSITSSARASSLSGIWRPSALAVVRLITISNLVGCSTGRSAGFVPRKILSTYSAARRFRAG